jgi:isoleucyl-tRNA synthetase
MTVALDTELTEELLEEGLAREFVNRVQNLRRVSGFEVTDRIRIYHRSSGRLSKTLARLQEYVRQETLAADLRELEAGDGRSLIAEEINGEKTEIAVERI